jgi:hypothetical protein
MGRAIVALVQRVRIMAGRASCSRAAPERAGNERHTYPNPKVLTAFLPPASAELDIQEFEIKSRKM